MAGNDAFHETLQTMDDDEREFTYTIDDGPGPVAKEVVQNYVGRVRVIPITENDTSFVDSDAGPFACHAYRFCDDTSTFIAECTEETWRRAGLDTAPISESLVYLAKVFEHELDGQPLLSNNSTWILPSP